MSHFCALEVSVSAFYDPKLDWQPGPGPRRLAARQERMRVEADCGLSLPEDAPARILHEVFSPEGKKVSELEEEIEGSRDSRKLFVPEPVWWSPEHPQLYTLVSTLLCGENSCVRSRSFGLRAVSYHPAWGFLFNGEPVSLHGVCVRKAPGVSADRESIKAQLQGLKKAGFDLLRAFDPDDALLECCDEAGLLMDAEVLSAGESAELSPSEAAARVAARLCRVQGHPCVVLCRAAGKETAWLSQLMQEQAPKVGAVCGADIPFELETENASFSHPGEPLEANGSFLLSDAGGESFSRMN